MAVGNDREKNHVKLYLKEWRKKNGLTLHQAGEIMGVSFATIYRWETMNDVVTVFQLHKMSEAYGASHPFQLLFSPNEISTTNSFWECWGIAKQLHSDDRQAWMTIGHRLAALSAGGTAQANPEQLPPV